MTKHEIEKWNQNKFWINFLNLLCINKNLKLKNARNLRLADTMDLWIAKKKCVPSKERKKNIHFRFAIVSSPTMTQRITKNSSRDKRKSLMFPLCAGVIYALLLCTIWCYAWMHQENRVGKCCKWKGRLVLFWKVHWEILNENHNVKEIFHEYPTR